MPSLQVELCKKSVEILNGLQPKPAFFVVCGDLVSLKVDLFRVNFVFRLMLLVTNSLKYAHNKKLI